MSDSLPDYWPRFRSQLGKGTPVPGATRGSKDCGMRSFQHAFGFLTHDKFVPWVDNIRQRMGRVPYLDGGELVVPGSNVWDMEKAAKTYDAALARRGRKPIRVYKKFSTASLRRAVNAGRVVQVAIDYGVFNRVMGRTGDPNYSGGHSVVVLGEKKWGNGAVVWKLYDSLDDERRPGIPQGPRWVPRWKVIKAAEAWSGGKGHVTAGVFRGGHKA